jgi:hypothetical protein
MSDVAIVVGTAKGVFAIRCSNGGADLSGPHLAGEQTYSVAIDDREDAPRFFAGSTSEHWGSVVRASEDLGATWTDPEIGNIKFPRESGAAVEHIWQLQPAGPDEPDVVYAGVEPAALFRSEDGGATFALVRGLWDHPHRPQWEPGFGGLCLHSIVVHGRDPRRLLVAISAGGVYRTDDGGKTWTACNHGIYAGEGPDTLPEFGQCVHRAAPDPVEPDTVFLQGHWGIYRTDDFGATWRDIAPRGPQEFGFPLVTHPRRSGVAYVIPLTSDEFRWPLDAKCRAFRTEDGGSTWEPLSNGLPQEATYFSVLRDAFCTDGGDPAGLYFGTRSGDVYGSADEGERWRLLASRLPPVLSVRAVALA